jgi:hypothetical protein
MRWNILLKICLTLSIVLAFSGCLETNDDSTTDDPNGNDEIELTGMKTYSGTWSGSLPGNPDADGTWEYTIDFEKGTVTGWFSGDGSGDITGSVSNGMIEASGAAAFGTVEWSGQFRSDGTEVSGEWELVEVPGSGTWSGTVSEGNDEEDDQDDTENGLPDNDQTSGDEPLDRYTGSIMLSYNSLVSETGSIIEITYGTIDDIDDIVDWYENKFGQPTIKETDDTEIILSYEFAIDVEYAIITITEDEDTYNIIEVEYIQAI